MAVKKNVTPASGKVCKPDQIEQTLDRIAESFVAFRRAPLLHWPDEAGLAYENVVFPSEDGVPLEGWFIPSPGSNKLVIANHPRWFNRAGLPSHLEPWKSLAGSAGNDFEVNFIPDYALLHHAGYNVLAYDMRNFGQSGSANGGIFSAGIFESRDVIGSLRYVRGRRDLANMAIGLFSRCMGGNATMYAMMRLPDEFSGIRCMVSPQPMSAGVPIGRALERLNVPTSYMETMNFKFQLKKSFHIEQIAPAIWASSVSVPSFLYQVRDDVYTRPEDVQAIFDAIPVTNKKLTWIEDTTRR